MRVLVVGTPQIAVPTLDALVASDHEVVAVVTRPDAPGRRGSELLPSPLKARALQLGLPVLTPERASDPVFVDKVAALGCDAAAVVAFGQILRPALLSTVRLAWVNLHFSVLPAWRGAAPVQRAIMAGDDVTGACTFVIEEGLDTGPVIGLVTETIRPTDTAGDLLDRLAVAGADLVVRSLDALGDGSASPVAQGGDGVSYAHKLTREDARVRWELASHIVDRQVRGCTPAPGAWTTLPDGTIAKIGPLKPREDLPGGAQGTIKEVAGAILVNSGSAPLEMSWIAPSGRRPMPAADWWRGSRLTEGAQLGEA
jgi:methionyl-tRNA formyltransferase